MKRNYDHGHVMQFEWNENKRQEILNDRGIDILDAARMFNSPQSMESWVDPRDYGGETRTNAIGYAEGEWYELVYVDRGEIVCLITAWRLNEKSKRKAQARYARRAERHGKEG